MDRGPLTELVIGGRDYSLEPKIGLGLYIPPPRIYLVDLSRLFNQHLC